jgi:hypothetical protein
MNRREFKKSREKIKRLLTKEKRRGTVVDLGWAQLHQEVLSGDLRPHRGQQRRR